MSENAIIQAVKAGSVKVLKKAAKKELQKADESGWCSIHWAAWSGNKEVCALILSRCSDLKDKMANDGCTACHIAVQYNHLAILEILVEAGANILALNLKMQTPLKLAADTKRLEAYRFLDNAIARLEAQNSLHVQKMQSRAYEELKKKVKKVEKGQRHASVSTYPVEGSQTSLDSQDLPDRRGKTLPARQRRVTDSDLRSATNKMHELSHKVNSHPFYDNFHLKNASSDEGLKESRGPSVEGDEDMPGDLIRKGSGGKLFPTRNNMLNALNSLDMPRVRSGSSSGGGGGGGGGDEERYVSGRSDSDSPYVLKEEEAEAAAVGFGRPPQPILSENDSPLVAFLHAYEVTDALQDLVKERMDLDALMMCSELDLQRAGIPLGPTKKIMAAVQQRRKVLEAPGKLQDIEI